MTQIQTRYIFKPMTREHKRIELANAEGFSSVQYVGENELVGRLGDRVVAVPDYFSDLEACRNLDELMNHTQSTEMRDWLWEMASYRKGKKNCASRDEQARNYVNASAAMRAEATGLALGLWKHVKDEFDTNTNKI